LPIRLLVGLGNPGKEYERTRHNAGFWLVERFALQAGVALRNDPKYQAIVGRMDGQGAWLVMPQGYMNASGRAVQMLAGFFKIPPSEILVAHDELDFTPGVAKRAPGAAKTTSQLAASWQLAAKVQPWTAATTGIGQKFSADFRKATA